MPRRWIRNFRAAQRPASDRQHRTEALSGEDAIVVVSGLPRSGTSLMMQMLEVGGIQPMTDGVRDPDRDNPNGYFEWEMIKQISHDHRILSRADVQGKAIKVISTLLPDLPKAQSYKVLFMQRDMTEIVRSQTIMLREQPEAAQDARDVARKLEAHNAQIIEWAEQAMHLELLMLNYRDMIRDPSAQIAAIAKFLGPSVLPYPDEMASVIDGSLYRNRKSGLVARLMGLVRS